jgi:hypothetical protein
LLTILGAGAVVLGIILKIILNKAGYDNPTLQECVNQFNQDLCKDTEYMEKTIVSFPFSQKILLILVGLGVLILLFKSIAFGRLGNYFVSDDNNVNCIQCKNRGEGWTYQYPTKSTAPHLSSMGLLIQKIRCKYAGKCICTNKYSDESCQSIAQSTNQDSLKWRTFISSKYIKNEDDIKHTETPLNVCGCCTKDVNGSCVLLNGSNTNIVNCIPNYLGNKNSK